MLALLSCSSDPKWARTVPKPDVTVKQCEISVCRVKSLWEKRRGNINRMKTWSGALFLYNTRVSDYVQTFSTNMFFEHWKHRPMICLFRFKVETNNFLP